MTTRQSYLEFAPPPTPGFLRGMVLAILAHGLLVAMLTYGVQWKRDAPLVTAEAELWSAVPQLAAPMPPPPEPAPEPQAAVPAPPPEPKPQPAPPPTVAPPSPPQPDPGIVVAREKARLLKEKRLADKLEDEKLLQDKRAREKLEQSKVQKLKEARDAQTLRDKLADEKKVAQKLTAEKLAADKKRQAALSKTQESAADSKRLAELRAQNLKRMAGLAGSGSESSQGSAAQSSGPTAGYAGRIRARIKPNITFTETPSGNPLADVEVRTSPDGTIISRRIVQSSGVKAWDEAVLSAIDKTEVLPRDVDGRVPPVLIIGFRPRD
ncbi:MAG: cell envelope integrity protein TolA [Candidatus Saccharibacteria bacterium]|nr:cell envelope integrity protein TolA [Rhodoferax sp.]